jgi:hypothetical protein
MRLLTIALTLAMVGTLAAHHSDAEPVGSSGVLVELDSSTYPGAVSAVPPATVVSPSENGWALLAVSGCAALALCCVLGLALSIRSRHTRRVDQAGTLVRSVWVSVVRWRPDAASALRPSLDTLSISRT